MSKEKETEKKPTGVFKRIADAEKSGMACALCGRHCGGQCRAGGSGKS